MDYNFAPIAEAMKSYSKGGALPFHTPGHKQGLGAHPLLKELITAEGLRREVSLMEELDDLHHPLSYIKEAQALAAHLWHADDAFFSVNGTTAAVQAMMLATLQPGDFVLVPRTAHRCVLSGLILTGAIPIYLTPDFDSHFGISLNLRLKSIQIALEQYPQAKALILVSPNYYGIAADLPAIATHLHKRGVILLVDEAHGAHLVFSNKLPISAMDAGADLSAISTHKLLGSLTQTSMLLLKSDLVSSEAVRRALSLLQSTSPNYLLLASLDIARLQMQQSGSELINKAILLSERLREAITQIPPLQSFNSIPPFTLDPTKVTVNVSALGLTGLAAEGILRHQFKIQCELSDVNNLLFLITYADTDIALDRLISSLKGLSDIHGDVELKPPLIALPNTISKLPPRQAFYSPITTVELASAVNRICAEEVTFYPPGIPVLLPGELITSDIVDYIKLNREFGRRIIGSADPSLQSIRIVNL